MFRELTEIIEDFPSFKLSNLLSGGRHESATKRGWEMRRWSDFWQMIYWKFIASKEITVGFTLKFRTMMNNTVSKATLKVFTLNLKGTAFELHFLSQEVGGKNIWNLCIFVSNFDTKSIFRLSHFPHIKRNQLSSLITNFQVDLSRKFSTSTSDKQRKSWNENRHFKIPSQGRIERWRVDRWWRDGRKWKENWKILCVPLENLPPH